MTTREPTGGWDGEQDALTLLIAHNDPASKRGNPKPEDCDSCERAAETAERVLAAGYRRVVEDDRTVERVALAIRDARQGLVWDDLSSDRVMARAALAVLRVGE